jgi:hypothetical protein
MAGAIAQDRQRCQFPFGVDEKPLFCRADRPESGRKARERSLMGRLVELRASSARRLALASGFALFRSFGIDRLDELGSAAVRGSIDPDG